MSALGWLVASFAVAAGSVVQGGVGFGVALVAVPVLVLVDPTLVPGPFLVSALVLNLLMAHREHAHAVAGEVGWAATGRVAGTVVGAALVAALTLQQRELASGLLVLLAVALSVGGLHLPVTRPALAGAGAGSGITGTLAGIGGPPMALVYQHHPGPHVRANMAWLSIIGTVQSALALAVVGAFGTEQAWQGLLLVPGTVAGFAASGPLARFLDGSWTRPAILAVATVGGLAVLVRAL